MKKVLKNILKWLICVFLTFSVIYTISQMYEISGGIYMILNSEKVMGEILEETEMLEESVKIEHEHMNAAFNHESEDQRISQLYNKYPAGTAILFIRIGQSISFGNYAIISLALGAIIGTAIYMLVDRDKKGLKIAVALYVISIVILGFVQGFINIRIYNGGKLSLLERWMFPDEYIVPVSIAFAVVVIVRFLKQKDIAQKLNEKLKEIKNK